MSLAHVTLTGTPTIVDGAASPPQRFELRRLRLTATDVTWPGLRPMNLEGDAEVAGGGTATLTGSLQPATLAVDARVAFDAVDVTRARAYVSEHVPFEVKRGRPGAPR